jgi:hypothetical protein
MNELHLKHQAHLCLLTIFKQALCIKDYRYQVVMESFKVFPFVVRVACCFCRSLEVFGVQVEIGQHEVRFRPCIVYFDQFN